MFTRHTLVHPKNVCGIFKIGHLFNLANKRSIHLIPSTTRSLAYSHQTLNLRRFKSLIPNQANSINGGSKQINEPTGTSQIKTTDQNDTQGKKSSDKSSHKNSKTKSDFFKLFKLAKPEYPILLGALGCLIITSTVSMSLPLIIGKIIDTVKEPEDSPISELPPDSEYVFGLTTNQFYTGLIIFFTLGSIANFGRSYLLRCAGETLVARLRSRLFLKILQQDSYFFDVGPKGIPMKTGDLISRISADTQVISKTLSTNISDGTRALVSGCVGLTMMYYVSWKLTLSMSLIFPPLILMSLFYGRRIKAISKTIQENLGSLTKATEEKLNGLKTIQSFAQNKEVVHEYNHEIRSIFTTSMKEARLGGIYYGANQFLGNVMLIGLLILGTRFIAAGEITIGDLSSFMMYTIYTASSVFGIGNFFTETMKGLGASERIFELMESKPRINANIGNKVNSIHGDIKFNDITFNYPSRKDNFVFKESKPFNLTIKKGEHLCFVGPSGSGKSTISQLLLRFYDPISGNITINGHDIKDLNLNHFRTQIGYVAQEPFLFSGTIRDNLIFGKRDATEEDIITATKASNAYDFIQEFPDKFDTIIGSNGAQLSGGQKQRISLARTLIKKPEILILDEATSALDSTSEEIVMQNLTKLSQQTNLTIISIAHRLSTIKNSEEIVVLNAVGEIVETGEFQKLIENNDSLLNKLLRSHELV